MAGIERLKRRAEFLRVASGRRKWVAPGLILQVARRQVEAPSTAGREGPAVPCVGFTASRKVGHAVQRNRARRRLRAAADEITDEHLHEARKRAKDLWHATQLLRPAAPKKLKRLSRRAHRLADLLGDDHDLAVLEQALRRLGPGELALRRSIIADLERVRGRLQKKARSRGKPVFRKKTRRLLGKLSARAA